MVGIRGMIDNSSAGNSNRYRKLSESGISKRLFFWGEIQSEIVSAENEYIEIVRSLFAANKNIEQLKHEITGLTTKYNQAIAESTRLSERLAEETTAHELLMDSYEINTKNWAEDGILKENKICKQEKNLVSQKNQISQLEADLAIAVSKTAELERSLAQTMHELSEKTKHYITLTTEYTSTLREKNDALDQISASEKIIADLNTNFEEREHHLTEIRCLKTTLASRDTEISELKQELTSLKDAKKQMLTEINRMGFVTVHANSEFRRKQKQLKEEQAKLAKEINQLERTKQSLQSDLSVKQQTLSTYLEITNEILEEWERHGDQTKASITEATGIVPETEKYGFLAKINGHRVLFKAFVPTSYKDLREADGLIREVAKELANLVDVVNCRKETFIVVPDECMIYLTKCLYASPLCSVQVITPSQVMAAVRIVARLVVYEKNQNQ
jgi:chromosome segregation ATPase